MCATSQFDISIHYKVITAKSLVTIHHQRLDHFYTLTIQIGHQMVKAKIMHGNTTQKPLPLEIMYYI